MFRLAPLAAALLICACGGGGGRPKAPASAPAAPVPSMSFAPGALDSSYPAGVSVQAALQATPSAPISQPLTLQVSGAGPALLDPSWSANADGSYTLSFSTSTTIPAATYSGTLQVTLCLDAQCRSPLAGSPYDVAYSITVTNPYGGTTPLNRWPGVPDWTTYQGNAAHTAWVPATLNPVQFAPRWTWTVPADSSASPPVLSTVSLADGHVYVNAGHKLYALEEQDASTIWTHDFSAVSADPGGPFYPTALNPPAAQPGQVFVTTSGQQGTYLWILSSADGSVTSQTPFAAQFESYLAPTPYGANVYNDGGLYGGMAAFDANSGTPVFFAPLAQFDEYTPAVDSRYAYAYLGSVVPGAPAQLYVLDHTGALQFSIADASYAWGGYAMDCAPVLGAANSVFAVDLGNPASNSLVDFDIAARTVSWTAPGPYSGSPAYANGVIYALNTSPLRLEVRSESGGALLWHWTPQQPGENQFVGDVLLTDNLVFLSTNVAVYAIDLATQQSVWSMATPGRLALSANGVLYIVTASSGAGAGTGGAIVAVNVAGSSH
jgi:hypothetical protein